MIRFITMAAGAAVLAIASLAAPAFGHGYRTGGLTIEHPWVKPLLGGRDVTAGYLVITNTGDTDDRLVAAVTHRAAVVELHTHVEEDGMMRMTKLEAVDLPAGETVEFAPGGLHLMVFGVEGELVVGNLMPVMLVFENAPPIAVELYVHNAPAHGGAIRH